MLGLSLGLSLSKTAAAIEFDPVSLFVSGETGAYYDFGDASTVFSQIEGESPTTPTSNGNVLGTVLDLSGNGNHAAAPSVFNRPDWFSDGYAQFAAIGSDYLRAAFTFNQTVTIIASIRLTESFSASAISGRTAMTLYQSSAGQLSLVGGGSALGTISFTTGEDFVVAFRASGATSRLSKNGGAYVTGTNPGTDAFGGLTLGADVSGMNFSDMRLYRFIAVGRDLTDNEILAGEAWCQAGIPA